MNCYAPNYQEVIPDAKFKALVIRSTDRVRPYQAFGSIQREASNSSNFQLNVYPAINGNYRVGNMTFYNSLYNVDSRGTSTASDTTLIYFTQSSTNYTAVIAVGAYNASTLPTAVAYAMNQVPGISGTFSCVYNTNTYTLTITNSTTAFSMNFSATNTGACDIMGFLRSPSVNTALTQTSDKPCNFNPYQSLFINIDQVANRYSNPLQQQAVLGCIHVPLTGVSGAVNQVKYSDMPIVLTFDNVSSLNVQVRDSAGNIVYLGSEWELQLIKIF